MADKELLEKLQQAKDIKAKWEDATKKLQEAINAEDAAVAAEQKATTTPTAYL